jgi:RNA-directed DNA polymerase
LILSVNWPCSFFEAHILDKELERRGHKFVRYADDFIILVKSQRAGERVFSSVRKFLKCELKLEANETKSKVAQLSECTFLGFQIKHGKIRWSQKSEKEFKRRIKELTGRSWGVSMKYRLMKLRQYMRGWIGYFGISEYYKPIPPLDQWIRRRVRMCYWKMWKKAQKRFRELLKLGVSVSQIKMVVSSRKAYWCRAKRKPSSRMRRNEPAASGHRVAHTGNQHGQWGSGLRS